MKTFHYTKEPTFAELWDKCVYELLYNIKDFTDDIENLFVSIGINKSSKIIDVSAGGGFPALDLILKGYKIDCIDASEDEIELFNKKATDYKLDVRCKKVLWENTPKLGKNGAYDFLFCRGNSFIYAGGGWNTEQDVNETESKKSFEQTLKNFYNLLKKGGYMYIDKFKDTEVSHREIVGEIRVADGLTEKLIFWTKRFHDQNIRKASMIREKQDGKEEGVPNVTYDLKGVEMEKMMKKVGFNSIKQITLLSEKHFQVWLCRK